MTKELYLEFNRLSQEDQFAMRYELIVDRLQKDLLRLKKEKPVGIDQYTVFIQASEKAEGLRLFIDWLRKSKEGWQDDSIILYHSLDRATFNARVAKGISEFIAQYRAFDTTEDKSTIPW